MNDTEKDEDCDKLHLPKHRSPETSVSVSHPFIKQTLHLTSKQHEAELMNVTGRKNHLLVLLWQANDCLFIPVAMVTHGRP